MSDERDLDAPLIAYLGAARYHDIYLTHGPNEIGKDIIAKRLDGGDVLQYVLQTKRGDISTGDWRTAREQMWEAVRIGLSHPAFSANLPRQGVLVLTGRLSGNAQEQIDLFNAELQRENRRRIEVWHGEKLVELFDSVDASTIYPKNKAGYLGYGQFFSVYGLALDGRITPRQIERHSRRWLSDSYDVASSLIPAIEAATLASAAGRAGNFYAAFQAHVALSRFALDATFVSPTEDRAFFSVVASEAIAQAVFGAARFANHVWKLREEAPDKKLIHVAAGGASFITYPLLCTQLGESLSLVFLGSEDGDSRSEAMERLLKLVTIEPGISNVFSDNQSVSIVLICRALAAAGEIDSARKYLRAVAYQALNLYANRLGMASLADDEQGELDRLVGMEFPDIRPPQRHESFMATAIVDLCAYLGDSQLYADVVNDIRHHGMYPHYYRPADSRGQFRLDAEDVVFSPNVEFSPTLQSEYSYGQHLVDESRSYQLSESFRGLAFICISLLLRDRYFPTTWGNLDVT